MELQAVLLQLETVITAKQREIMRDVARYLLLANRQRISRNVQPDGSAMPRRQNGAGRMFRKIGGHLRQRVNADSASIGFSGRTGWVATNHQLGRSVRRGNYRVDLPVRELLGLPAADQRAIATRIMTHLNGGLAA